RRGGTGGECSGNQKHRAGTPDGHQHALRSRVTGMPDDRDRNTAKRHASLRYHNALGVYDTRKLLCQLNSIGIWREEELSVALMPHWSARLSGPVLWGRP